MCHLGLSFNALFKIYDIFGYEIRHFQADFKANSCLHRSVIFQQRFRCMLGSVLANSLTRKRLLKGSKTDFI